MGALSPPPRLAFLVELASKSPGMQGTNSKTITSYHPIEPRIVYDWSNISIAVLVQLQHPIIAAPAQETAPTWSQWTWEASGAWT